MKSINKTIAYIALPLLLLVGCDGREEEPVSWGRLSEVHFSGLGKDFVQTRSSSIGADGAGLKYGTIYMLQTSEEQQPIVAWGHYKAKSATGDELEAVDDEHTLFWKDDKTNYFFRGISVPALVEEGTEPGVTFKHGEDEKAEGTVRFGDYKTGLEYFVGVTIGPKNLSAGQTQTMTFKRQISKVVFLSFAHYKPNSEAPNPVRASCEIIFPNLPATATFDMEHFRSQQGTYPGMLKEQNDYVTLIPGKKGVKMTWVYDSKVNQIAEQNIRYAFYLPPFKFWDGADSRPENQSGFFIVKYDGKTYTGNIYGNDRNTQLFAGDYCLLNVSLREGPVAGGGNGSAIAEWKVKEEEETLHHPLPGIYSQEEAERLLQGLKSGNIPEAFYKEETDKTTGNTVKVIRLFKNIDWSTVTGQLLIPDGFVLAGQGYNIQLGERGSIGGELQGKLYINGVLYKDGIKQ